MKSSLAITLPLLLPALLLAGELKTLRLTVEHLACESCAEKFRSDLAPLCQELKIDLRKGEALCTYEPPVTPKQILSRAKKSGLRTHCVD